MKTAKGLHLWLVTFSSVFDNKLYVTTRLRAPQVAIKRAQQAGKDQGYRSPIQTLDYKGTIDA